MKSSTLLSTSISIKHSKLKSKIHKRPELPLNYIPLVSKPQTELLDHLNNITHTQREVSLFPKGPKPYDNRSSGYGVEL